MQKYTPPTQSVFFFYIDTFTFYVLCKKKKKEEKKRRRKKFYGNRTCLNLNIFKQNNALQNIIVLIRIYIFL